MGMEVKAVTHKLHWHASMIGLALLGLIALHAVLVPKTASDTAVFKGLTAQTVKVKPTANGLAEVSLNTPEQPKFDSLDPNDIGRAANLTFSLQ